MKSFVKAVVEYLCVMLIATAVCAVMPPKGIDPDDVTHGAFGGLIISLLAERYRKV